ncbi:MAG: nitrilase-related carbon-nitrogen hydrolase [Nonlabens sp.]
MQHLNISLIQSELFWEDPVLNKIAFSKKLENLYGQTDLVVLPEMFTTGFSMNPQHLAEDKTVYQFLYDHANKGGFAIYGSVMFRTENECYVNRGIFMCPDGIKYLYDKRHTFTLAGEHRVYQKGQDPVVAFYKGLKFNLQICYDLRFPVFARNTTDYDVLLYVANWPVPRIAAWDALLKARAIENMAYCIGVNRTGRDGTGMEYNGHSQVYDVLGKEFIEHPWENPGIRQVKLERQHIDRYRSKLRFLGDRDEFTLN